MTITFFDIPSNKPEKAWSVNMWRIRFALNFKGILYKTEWLEYPEVAPHAQKHGIPPTGKKPDGSPHYTVPAIYDPSTGLYVSDSLKVAEYLDKTYPDAPALFPNNTQGLQLAFTDAFFANHSALWNFILPAVYSKLNPPSLDHFRRHWEGRFGKKLEDLTPTGEEAVKQWAELKKGFGNVDAWYAKNGGKGPFLLGETASWGDLAVASCLIWMRIIFGEDSQKWLDIASWHGGRWKDLLDNLKEYQTVV